MKWLSFHCWTLCVYSLFSNPTITFPVALWWMFKTLAGLFLLQPPDWLLWFPMEATTNITWSCEARLKLHSLFIGYVFSESCHQGFFASASWSNVIIYFSYLFCLADPSLKSPIWIVSTSQNVTEPISILSGEWGNSYALGLYVMKTGYWQLINNDSCSVADAMSTESDVSSLKKSKEWH